MRESISKAKPFANLKNWRLVARWGSIVSTSLLLASSAVSVPNANAQQKNTDDREAFTQHVLQIATQEFPNLNLKKSDKPLQCTWIKGNHLFLNNLYKTIRQDTESGKEDDEIRRFLKSITELNAPLSANWEDVKLKLRPQIVPSMKVKVDKKSPDDTSQPAKKVLVHRPLPFSNKLYEGFVIDSENTFQYVYQENLQKWNVNLDTVSKCAYENLSRNSQNLKLEINDDGGKDPKGKYITISIPDGYAATRILLPEVRKRLQKDLGEKCYVGIPNRDYLIAWAPDAPHQERFVEQVRKRFQSRHHPLTPQVYQLDETSLSNAVIITAEPEPPQRPKRPRRKLIRRKIEPAVPGQIPAQSPTPGPTPDAAPATPTPPVSPPSQAPIPGFDTTDN